jgi:hypothetical protein
MSGSDVLRHLNLALELEGEGRLWSAGPSDDGDRRSVVYDSVRLSKMADIGAL